MMKMMMKMSLWLLALSCTGTLTAAGPGSCVSRCAEPFSRGQQCTCDLNCLQHNECCPDYVDVCTNAGSCQGRCGETFRRGRQCECDAQCVEYNTCCHDYQLQCSVRTDPPDVLAVSVHPFAYNPVPASPSQGLRPGSLQDLVQALGLGLGLVEGGTEGPRPAYLSDVDLCSDAPINGLTALSNGTVLVFKGELFWSVDPVSRSVGPPLRIRDTLGVPTPIDTVFTRCNCQGQTYILKGDQYWRLDQDLVKEPGFPKRLSSEFPGLKSGVRAALPVPASPSRPESVLFFRKGDVMQRFTFPASNTPSCSRTPRGSVRGRAPRQGAPLSEEINIKVTLKGFPVPVTSALTLPRPQRSDPYEHYVFSGPLFFSVSVSGNLPALIKPPAHAALAPQPLLAPAVAVTTNVAAPDAKPQTPANAVGLWLRCP